MKSIKSENNCLFPKLRSNQTDWSFIWNFSVCEDWIILYV